MASSLRGHALRLSLDVSRLSAPDPQLTTGFDQHPAPERLRVAAASLAAAWFQLRGYDVLWPQEGCRYDLVAAGHQVFSRIQVKSTTYRQGDCRMATISATRAGARAPYDVGEIDHFFIVDGNLDAYLIPFAAVAGRNAISLGRYRRYRVAERGQWLAETSVSAAASP